MAEEIPQHSLSKQAARALKEQGSFSRTFSEADLEELIGGIVRNASSDARVSGLKVQIKNEQATVRVTAEQLGHTVEIVLVLGNGPVAGTIELVKSSVRCTKGFAKKMAEDKASAMILTRLHDPSSALQEALRSELKKYDASMHSGQFHFESRDLEVKLFRDPQYFEPYKPGSASANIAESAEAPFKEGDMANVVFGNALLFPAPREIARVVNDTATNSRFVFFKDDLAGANAPFPYSRLIRSEDTEEFLKTGKHASLQPPDTEPVSTPSKASATQARSERVHHALTIEELRSFARTHRVQAERMALHIEELFPTQRTAHSDMNTLLVSFFEADEKRALFAMKATARSVGSSTPLSESAEERADLEKEVELSKAVLLAGGAIDAKAVKAGIRPEPKKAKGAEHSETPESRMGYDDAVSAFSSLGAKREELHEMLELRFFNPILPKKKTGKNAGEEERDPVSDRLFSSMLRVKAASPEVRTGLEQVGTARIKLKELRTASDQLVQHLGGDIRGIDPNTREFSTLVSAWKAETRAIEGLISLLYEFDRTLRSAEPPVREERKRRRTPAQEAERKFIGDFLAELDPEWHAYWTLPRKLRTLIKEARKNARPGAASGEAPEESEGPAEEPARGEEKPFGADPLNPLVRLREQAALQKKASKRLRETVGELERRVSELFPSLSAPQSVFDTIKTLRDALERLTRIQSSMAELLVDPDPSLAKLKKLLNTEGELILLSFQAADFLKKSLDADSGATPQDSESVLPSSSVSETARAPEPDPVESIPDPNILQDLKEQHELQGKAFGRIEKRLDSLDRRISQLFPSLSAPGDIYAAIEELRNSMRRLTDLRNSISDFLTEPQVSPTRLKKLLDDEGRIIVDWFQAADILEEALDAHPENQRHSSEPLNPEHDEPSDISLFPDLPKARRRTPLVSRRNILRGAGGLAAMGAALGSGYLIGDTIARIGEPKKSSNEEEGSKEPVVRVRFEITRARKLMKEKDSLKMLESPYLVSTLYYSDRFLKELQTKKNPTPGERIISEIASSDLPQLRLRFADALFKNTQRSLSQLDFGAVPPLQSFDFGTGDNHFDAIDLFAPEGTPVHSMYRGIVVLVEDGWKEGEIFSTSSYKGGNCVTVYIPDRRAFARYCHLKDVVVKTGALVNRGAVLGSVGSTGENAVRPGHGNHLHLEINHFNRRGEMEAFDFLRPFIRSLQAVAPKKP